MIGPLLFFEISDKILSFQDLYLLALVPGASAVLLGLLRWWFAVLWLVFPVIFAYFQLREVYVLYENVILEMGVSYVWHSYVSAAIAVLLNLFAVFFGVYKANIINCRKLI